MDRAGNYATLQDIMRSVADKAILAQKALENQNFGPLSRYLEEIVELTDEAEGAPAELDFG